MSRILYWGDAHTASTGFGRVAAPEQARAVTTIDHRCLASEQGQLFDLAMDWHLGCAPFDGLLLHFWTPEVAEQEFVKRLESHGINV